MTGNARLHGLAPTKKRCLRTVALGALLSGVAALVPLSAAGATAPATASVTTQAIAVPLDGITPPYCSPHSYFKDNYWYEYVGSIYSGGYGYNQYKVYYVVTSSWYIYQGSATCRQ